jgi:hypothetical protein
MRRKSLLLILHVLFKVWYNNKGWPASVAFLNIFNNALLRGVLQQTNPSVSIGDYGITAMNHPLPQTDIQIDSNLQSSLTLEMFSAICIIFALAFIPASFIVFLIDERVTTSKHLQFVSGVKGKKNRILLIKYNCIYLFRYHLLVVKFCMGFNKLLCINSIMYDCFSCIWYRGICPTNEFSLFIIIIIFIWFCYNTLNVSDKLFF